MKLWGGRFRKIKTNVFDTNSLNFALRGFSL